MHLRQISFAWIFSISLLTSAAVAVVCREPAIDGFQSKAEQVAGWIGDDVTDTRSIKVYITKIKRFTDNQLQDYYYIQSNYKSMNIGDGTISENPTKISEKIGALSDIENVLGNIVFWPADHGAPPDNWEEQASGFLKTTEIFLDPDFLGSDGRPPFDLSNAKSVKLANDSGEIPTGEIETLNLGEPPPALVERIFDCCFNGRPAGRGKAIEHSLSKIPFDKSSAGILSLVIDSTTTQKIMASPTLKDAASRGKNDFEGNWSDKLDQSLAANSGKTLVVLSHVSEGAVAVEAANGDIAYRIPLDELHQKARDKGVNLILLGCETANRVQSSSRVGVAGQYDTQFAAGRLEYALQNSKTASEFLSNLSTKGLTIVAQEGAWSPNGVGATYYSASGSKLASLKRAFRVWFFGEKNG